FFSSRRRHTRSDLDWSSDVCSSDLRQHELTIQVRPLDTPRSGNAIGVPVLLALGSALLEKSLKGGLVIVGGLNLGGGIEPVYNEIGRASCREGVAPSVDTGPRTKEE